MAQTHRQIVQRLTSRWPEHRIAPGTARVEALCELLGSPQHGYPVIQIAGTNGKGSTAIMIDALLRELGLRTGRFTSPHLVHLTERICIDGEPMDDAAFDALVADTQPLIDLVDGQSIDGVPMTFFEVITALAYEAFAQAPVDVAIVEVGLGGVTDATNVMDAAVAVICPIDYDHTQLLGDSLTEIAIEKAGIIKSGAQVVLAAQQPAAATVLIERCAEVAARTYREGVEFSLLDRTPAVGGQVIRIDSAGGPVGDLVLPLFGEHMARNAALAVAAVEAFLGGKPLAPDIIAEGLAGIVAPARLEVVRRSPVVLLDTCHNPHGARATINAMTEAFTFTALVGVVAVMADKDVDGLLRIFAEEMTTVVCTTIEGTNRAMSPQALGQRADGIFGEDRVRVAATLAGAIEVAVGLADEAGPGSGVLIAGSVIAAGQARALLVREATA